MHNPSLSGRGKALAQMKGAVEAPVETKRKKK